MNKRLFWVLVLGTWGSLLGNVATAEEKPLCDPNESKIGAAKIAAVQGKVEAKRTTDGTWHSAKRNAIYCPGDQIRVGKDSRASIVLSNETLIRLDQYSVITLSQIEKEGPSLLELIQGIAHFISRVPRSLKVNTPFVNAAIEGTEFVVAVKENDTTVTVFEGTVLTENENGQVRLTQNESSIAKKGQAPEKILLAKPRNAVQWALYFPPIIKADEKGNQLQQASALLYIGHVEEASALLAEMAGNGDAKALQAIIAIVNNDKDSAAALAKEAIQLAPDSAAPHIAMSYVRQAQLDLEQALTSAEQATNKVPDNAIAWARLAELQLSVGNLDDALSSAKKASDLDSSIARSQTILGFAYLTQIKTGQARATFNKAIELNQSDPLPYLGLGLAMIRENELTAGRREIEISASLDPNNAIIRSYLGKAYYEEKRGPLDAEQFAMAKALDPNDPTPYFYDAIRKQTENNPVGALEDLTKSIELNNNRAVYRSSMQLDQDEAARQASIASIYRDLNFDELAQIQAYDSLNKDFTNASAHRFLAESLGNRNRHEIARASEALQASLLSPVTLTPVPPSFSESNSGTLPNAGPGQASLNEYNNLFVRDNSAWNISTIAGDQQTAGDEVVYSQLFENTAVSLGQYHYQTEGFRENNDFQQDIFNLFLHSAITENQSLQFEFKNNEKEFGDRRLKFDPADFSTNRRETQEEDSYRLGYHAKLSPDSHLLTSLTHQDTIFSRDESEQVSPVGPFGPVISTSNQYSEFSTRSAELQYNLDKNIYQIIIGAGDYHQDQFQNDLVTLTSGGIPIGGGPTVGNKLVTHSIAYFYNYIDFDSLDITLGLSADDYDRDIININQVNGKIGIHWDITKGTKLRTAAFRTLKRSLTTNQTIEPTQVAGFNQFYDDPLGTDATNYGLALDSTVHKDLSVGLEAIQRDLDIPILSTGTVRIDEAKEYIGRIYLHWLISEKFSFTTNYELEEFKREIQSISSVSVPSEVITKSIPLNIKYFANNQFFTSLTATYVDQRVAQPTQILPTLLVTHTNDTFWVLDYEFGYRLPKRNGVLSLVVNNMTDEAFNYQDTNFFTGLESDPRFSHNRTYFIKLSINID